MCLDTLKKGDLHFFNYIFSNLSEAAPVNSDSITDIGFGERETIKEGGRPI
jgi:hypothetical protein